MAATIYGRYKLIQYTSRLFSAERENARYRQQNLRAARKLYATAVKLEGLLIKTCQFIATRADILPDEWVETLAGLHDRVPPRSFSLIRKQVERELGRRLEDLFKEFERLPLASASLAQVHRARLRDGRLCAVKVQYPGIEARVRADLRNLELVVRLLARLERQFDFTAIMREILKYVPMELDFINEAANCERIRANFAADDDVLVPEIYRDFSGRRVLTMEYIEGIKVTDVAALECAGIDKHWVAQKLTEVYCKQILSDGFFQADPHPGNIMVQPGPRLVLLDFGLAKDFPPAFREGLVRLTLAILLSDRAAISSAFAELGFRTRDGSMESMVAVSDLLIGNAVKRNKPYADRELMEEISDGLPKALKANPIVEVPGDVLLVSRVMGLLSGLGKSLDSHVDLMATMLPYTQSLLASLASSGVGSGANDGTPPECPRAANAERSEV